MTDADRLTRTLNAALHSPDFALRLLTQSRPAERAEMLRRWSQLPGSSCNGAAPESPAPSAQPKPAPASLPLRPGLRKCGTLRHATQSHDLALQLAAFSRSIGRVG
ncbi:MAG TPA: hypothetical protein VFS67_18040 [Polyangiaceae bacterium]|jgi:hypothetical protein|nr:hypothetical protein [Polyangiaceae bacterium]